MNERPTIWVIDASAIIEAKRFLPANRQWAFFEALKLMVQAGELVFPRRVTGEIAGMRYPDTPETWALDTSHHVRHAYDPADRFMEIVMARAGEVVTGDEEGDPGDPYVLAQALELQGMGMSPCVVTEDRIDRLPLKISMVTACGRLDLDCVVGLAEFVERVGFDLNRPPR